MASRDRAGSDRSGADAFGKYRDIQNQNTRSRLRILLRSKSVSPGQEPSVRHPRREDGVFSAERAAAHFSAARTRPDPDEAKLLSPSRPRSRRAARSLSL